MRHARIRHRAPWTRGRRSHYYGSDCEPGDIAQCTSHRSDDAVLSVATRELQDPLFVHSVIPDVPSLSRRCSPGCHQHSRSKRVRDLFPEVHEFAAAGRDDLYGRAGRAGRGVAIFRASSAQSSATRVFDDVYVANGRERDYRRLKDPRITELRVISGKAQWLHDQLLGEVMAGAWYVIPAKADLLSATRRTLVHAG